MFDPQGLGACALAIADVFHIENVTMANLAVFSINQTCISVRDTAFKVSPMRSIRTDQVVLHLQSSNTDRMSTCDQVPAAIPSCTGPRCICVWLWLPKFGQGNFCKHFDLTFPAQCPSSLPGYGCDEQRSSYFFTCSVVHVHFATRSRRSQI